MSSDETFLLLAVLAALGAAAVFIERTRIGKALSVPAIIILASMAASHIGLIPRQAPLYDAIWTYVVPFAIALFLFKADLRDIAARSGPVLLAFLIGAAGAAAGALLASLLIDLGPDEAKLAAVFSATYTGGSLNFAGVAQAIDFQDPSKLSAALAIDNVLGTLYILGLNLLAAWRLFRNRFPWGAEVLVNDDRATTNGAAQPLQLSDFLNAIAIAAAVCAASAFSANALALDSYALLFITVIMTALATLGRKWIGKIRGEDVMALGLMYLFFAVIGAGADITEMLSSAPAVIVLVLSIFIVHLIFLVGAAALLKLNYGVVIVASLACITGPPVAAAIAVLFGWRSLVTPGILTGILGYILGNFIGIGIFHILGGG